MKYIRYEKYQFETPLRCTYLSKKIDLVLSLKSSAIISKKPNNIYIEESITVRTDIICLSNDRINMQETKHLLPIDNTHHVSGFCGTFSTTSLSPPQVDFTTQQKSTFTIPNVSQRKESSAKTTNIDGKYVDLIS